MFSLEAQAKINLTLDVLGKRPDGYHEVEMIMQSIQLHDVLHFSLREQGLELISAVEGVADDKDNLIYQTAVKLKELYNVTAGAKIILEKNIPVAAGLFYLPFDLKLIEESLADKGHIEIEETAEDYICASYKE